MTSMNPIDALIASALAEDLGSNGDVTSRATIDERLYSKASAYYKTDGIVAGLSYASRTFSILADMAGTARPEVSILRADGSRASKGDVIFTVCGPTRLILSGERTFLNIVQRMSAIATMTSRFCEAVKGTGARIVDTRKTTPNFRLFEKEAVRIGGASNHRFGLYDGVLIKDNHIAACGGIGAAIAQAKRSVHHLLKIEVEVSDLAGVREALAAGADVIMLDNMGPDGMREAVEVVAGKALVEASGGITLETVRAVAQAGVDLISVGALTHSAGSADISLKITETGRNNG